MSDRFGTIVDEMETERGTKSTVDIQPRRTADLVWREYSRVPLQIQNSYTQRALWLISTVIFPDVSVIDYKQGQRKMLSTSPGSKPQRFASLRRDAQMVPAAATIGACLLDTANGII